MVQVWSAIGPWPDGGFLFQPPPAGPLPAASAVAAAAPPQASTLAAAVATPLCVAAAAAAAAASLWLWRRSQGAAEPNHWLGAMLPLQPAPDHSQSPSSNYTSWSADSIRPPPEIDAADLVLGEEIGIGRSAIVFRATWVRSHNSCLRTLEPPQ